ncbi:MAG TPA: hypothetical protein VHF69_02380, partial [Candidatus Synoicihabitans sp.]|nr:hypothetical protein [Candidatus Synoicihabitans sp.]
ISDVMEPFGPLVRVLRDVAEVDRSRPGAYAAALAREPRIKPPWWSWILIGLAVTAFVFLGNLLGNERRLP